MPDAVGGQQRARLEVGADAHHAVSVGAVRRRERPRRTEWLDGHRPTVGLRCGRPATVTSDAGPVAPGSARGAPGPLRPPRSPRPAAPPGRPGPGPGPRPGWLRRQPALRAGRDRGGGRRAHRPRSGAWAGAQASRGAAACGWWRRSTSSTDAEPFVSVVGVLHLATLADGAAALERLRRLRHLLAPEGRLLLFEPLRRPGWRSSAVDVVVGLRGPRTRARHRRGGVRTAHPVPELARRAGFMPTSVERITMPSPLPPLRWCVRLVAVPDGEPRPPAARR